MTSNTPLLCIVHIPKTAGSAIRTTLTSTLGEDKIYWIGHRRPHAHWEEAKGDDFDKFDIVGGHRGAVAYDKIKRPKVFMAVLRDPVQRAISLFNFICNGDGVPHPLRDELRSLSIIEALEKVPQFRNEITNSQCNFIGGERNYQAALRSICQRNWFISPHDQIEDLFARVCSSFNWPKMKLIRDNFAKPGYEEEYYTKEVIAALAEINREDDRLLNIFRGLSGVVYNCGSKKFIRSGQSVNEVLPSR